MTSATSRSAIATRSSPRARAPESSGAPCYPNGGWSPPRTTCSSSTATGSPPKPANKAELGPHRHKVVTSGSAEPPRVRSLPDSHRQLRDRVPRLWSALTESPTACNKASDPDRASRLGRDWAGRPPWRVLPATGHERGLHARRRAGARPAVGAGDTPGRAGLRALSLRERTVVTWRRTGHTCVLSASAVPTRVLEQLAHWPAARISD
jgi:hypothetical protein